MSYSVKIEYDRKPYPWKVAMYEDERYCGLVGVYSWRWTAVRAGKKGLRNKKREETLT